jgi:dimethylaniline monooxygenase (N-oxide forming)
MKKMRKKIAVIGAGLSGLVTVKELREKGHQPVCYERALGLGGVFRFNEKDGVIWESCRLTSSGYLTAFSDFPVTPEHAEHMHASEYIKYLEEYCEKFGVLEHVQFGQSVKSVRRKEDGRWIVRSSGNAGDLEETFDAITVCSGLHQDAHIPAFAGLESFTGETMHAAQYRRPGQVKDKKVLVVGAGESGADIAAEMSKNAVAAVLSLRRGVSVVSRTAFGKPRDYLTSRLMNSAAHWVFQTRNPKDDHKRTVYRYLGLPIVILDKMLQIFYRQIWENIPMFLSGSLSEIKTNLRTRKLTMQLLAESGGTVNEQFGTKDDAFVRALAAGTLKRVGGIDRFEGRSVYFNDGTVFKPDLVVFCTGFETRMHFFDEPLAAQERYLNTFCPTLGASLAFIGFVRPAFGAIPPLAELQARWFALLLSGEVELPSISEMNRSIDSWARHRQHIFRAKEDRLTHLVDHTEYCDLLAEQVGCKPGSRQLKKENAAFRRRYVSGPFVAAQYRLTGPGAKPEIARKVIENMPLAHPWPDWVNLQLRWRLCQVLEWALGPKYAPKLSNRQ